jgi:arsenate reductase-like glutaredoxin family protein
MPNTAEEMRKFLKEHDRKKVEMCERHYQESRQCDEELSKILKNCAHDEVEHRPEEYFRETGSIVPAWDRCKICGLDVTKKEVENANKH